jgi:ubiquinone/menaquinone biosynthesis C-methylase UbiE
MKWFGRKREAAVGVPAQSPRTPAATLPRHTDWRTYDEVAADYARAVAPQLRPIANDLVAVAEVPASGRLLDVGTGTGVVLEAAAGLAAFGVDPSIPMLTHGRPGMIAAADTINLPFRNDTFHAATASLVLPLFRKLDTALFDVIRVLRPGGVLAVATWEEGEDELQKMWRELAERAVGLELMRDELRDAEPWAAVAGNRTTLEQALRDAGLHPVRVERRKYKLNISREDYISEKTTEATGRFVRGMLADEWPHFLELARAAYAATFPEMLVDFRDVLFAVGTKP